MLSFNSQPNQSPATDPPARTSPANPPQQSPSQPPAPEHSIWSEILEARMLKPLFALLALLFFAPSQQPATPAPPSGAPADPAHMPNPIKPTPESQAKAKKMYGYDC